MTRAQGILTTWRRNNTTELKGDNVTRLIQTEYKNYIELCEYCGEQPKTFIEWTNETIKPLKK